jgi:hypothetical protein
MRPGLETALREVCEELSGDGIWLAWRPSTSTIEARRAGAETAEPLACCELERTSGGLVARQRRGHEREARLEHGYSLAFAPETLWRRWTDGAELTDEDLAAELVGWTFRLAMDRAAGAAAPATPA